MVMWPPTSVLLAPFFAVALIWEFFPIVSFWVFITMSPGSPALLLSVVRLVPFFRVKSVVSILIWPASPLFFVEALMATPLDILSCLFLFRSFRRCLYLMLLWQ